MNTFTAEVYPVVLDDTRHVLGVDVGCTVADMVPAERHAVVIVNNRILAPEEYATVEPSAGDHVVIRAVPTGIIVGAVAAIGASAAAGAAASAFTAGALLAAAGYAALAVGISVVGGLIQRSLIEPPDAPDTPDPKRLPGITGQSNRVDPFGVIDTIYGTVRVIPKLGGKPYTEIAGDDQFLRMLIVVGHGPLEFDESDIELGDTPLTNYDDYSVEIRHGYDEDDPVTLYKNVVDETNPNVPLNDTNDQFIRTTPQDTTRVSIDLVAQGLAQRQSDGTGTSSVMVAYTLEYRPAGGGAWVEATINDTSGSVRTDPTSGFPTYTFGTGGDTLDTVRFSVGFDVPQGQYDVRLTRIAAKQLFPTEGIDSNLAMTDMSWSAFRSFVVNDGPIIQYPGPLALIALRIRASDQLNGVIDDLSVLCRSVIEIPGQGRTVTDNPAWLMRDVLTGNSAKTRVETSRLSDLSPFATFCADRNYAFKAVVNPGDRYSVLAQILSLGRGSVDMSAGQFGVVYEHTQPARQMFTPRNSWDFSGNRKFDKIPHALRTQYLDPNTWESNEVIVYRDGYNKANAIRFEKFDISYGCANLEQAIQMAQEKLREIVLRPEGFRLTTDIEYLAVGRGGRVKHAHDAILVGLGSARITAIDGNQVSFDQTFDMRGGVEYGIEVRDDTAQVYAVPVENVPGLNGTVTVTEALPGNIATGDLVAFGETSRITQDLIIKSIDVDAERAATLELIPYAPEIYEIGQPLPEYDSNITQPTDQARIPPATPVIEQLRSDEGVLRRASDGSLLPQIEVSYQIPSSTRPPVVAVDAQWRKHETGPWQKQQFRRNERIVLGNVQEGAAYDVRIRTVSHYAVVSEWDEVLSHEVIGKTSVPPDVTGFEAGFEEFAVQLSWDRIRLLDIAGYEIEQDVEGTWIPVDLIDAASRKVEVLPTDGQPSKAYPFRIRAADTGQRVSENWTYQTAVVSAPPQPSLSYTFDGPDMVLTWTPVSGDFPVSEFRVYRDGVLQDSPKTNQYRTKVTWGDEPAWSVATVDVAKNEGAAATVEVGVQLPIVSQRPAQVIDNNVLLYWDGTPGSLPIERYIVRRGMDDVGNSQGSFTTIFESNGGEYSYTLIPIDTAGNEGGGDSRAVTVSEPPDFVLRNTFSADFSGAKTNAYVEKGNLILPVVPQTWAEHFNVNHWNTPQDQIDAGFSIYIQPSAASGSYQEEYDAGVVIPSSRILVDVTADRIAGNADISVQIETRETTGDNWTIFDPGLARVYATSFRYIRVTVTVSTADQEELARIRAIYTEVSTKLKSDQGTVDVTSNPTRVTFNTSFIDVDSIVATIKGTSSGKSVIYDFTDVPNPTGFDLYVFEGSSGNPDTATVSWQTRGS